MLNTAETNEFSPFASTPPFKTFHIQRAGDRLLGHVGGGGDIADGFQRGVIIKNQHQRQGADSSQCPGHSSGVGTVINNALLVGVFSGSHPAPTSAGNRPPWRSPAMPRAGTGYLAVKQNNDRQHHACQQQVFGAPKVWSLIAA